VTTEKNPFDPLGIWADTMSKMFAPMWSGMAEMTPPEAARQMRGPMLEAWASAAEQFMRSPWFLEAMRQTMETNVDFRKRLGDWLGQWHHEMQSVSRQDFDQIIRGMRHLEHRAADGIDRLGDMLEEMHERLDALERRLGPAPGEATDNGQANDNAERGGRSTRRRRSSR
jgi:hypothetical protein